MLSAVGMYVYLFTCKPLYFFMDPCSNLNYCSSRRITMILAKINTNHLVILKVQCYTTRNNYSRNEKKILPGLQSDNSEHTESKILDTVNAGLQLSFKISKQITPWLLILQWYMRVRKVTCKDNESN